MVSVNRTGALRTIMLTLLSDLSAKVGCYHSSCCNNDTSLGKQTLVSKNAEDPDRPTNIHSKQILGNNEDTEGGRATEKPPIGAIFVENIWTVG